MLKSSAIVKLECIDHVRLGRDHHGPVTFACADREYVIDKLRADAEPTRRLRNGEHPEFQLIRTG